MNEKERLHMERAESFLLVASKLLDEGSRWDAVSRAYYAIFHAATAMLERIGESRTSHHGVWGAFGSRFAATGRVDPRLHRIALRAFMLRQDCDYAALPEVDPTVAAECVANARIFLDECHRFLKADSDSARSPSSNTPLDHPPEEPA